MSAKNDQGKLKLSLVPRQIIRDIAAVRMFGTEKYKDPENWKTVEVERYRDAAYRHFLAYLDDPQSIDPESGLTHLAHLACNIAFLCELENKPQTHTWVGERTCKNCAELCQYPRGKCKTCENLSNWIPANKETGYA